MGREVEVEGGGLERESGGEEEWWVGSGVWACERKTVLAPYRSRRLCVRHVPRLRA